MKRKINGFISTVKKNKQTRALVIIGIFMLFIFTLGYSLSIFSSVKIASLANIKINDLSFNMTTNGGTTNDRILHLKAGKTEVFNVVLTNLNKVSVKYELIYDVCSDPNCTSTLSAIPNNIKVQYVESGSDGINGTIEKNNESKKISLLTVNNGTSDVYVKLNLNAGYSWNDLDLANQIDLMTYSLDTQIVAYIDGVETNAFPTTCNYSVIAKAYIDNQEVTLDNLSLSCDMVTKKWTTLFTGFAEKIKLDFTHKYTTYTTFAQDSWENIQGIIQDGNLDAYPVGAEKEVEIGGTNYTVRVANNTTPAECGGEDFSDTACGFVVEFVDIVDSRVINGGKTNVGGWPAAPLRTYINGNFFAKLPSDLQGVIADTKVISGHGSSDKANFTSTDKLFLLGGHEVYSDPEKYDTAYNQTRQLDYYANLGVSTTNYSSIIKQRKGTNTGWWLRTPTASVNMNFIIVANTGKWDNHTANGATGVAPAFRIL